MKNHYIVKKITKKQNRKNMKALLKEVAAFLVVLAIATTISILAWT